MRIVVTTSLMLLAGFFAGGLAAQLLAVETGAEQEFILVFVGVAMMLAVSTIVFLVVQFFENVRRGAAIAALSLLLLICTVTLGLIVIDLISDPDHGSFAKNWPILAGLSLPNAITVITQWLVVRWRNPASPVAPLFGRRAA